MALEKLKALLKFKGLKVVTGTFLIVQWLRLQGFNAGGKGSICGKRE